MLKNEKITRFGECKTREQRKEKKGIYLVKEER